jgi:hypothetical protein
MTTDITITSCAWAWVAVESSEPIAEAEALRIAHESLEKSEKSLEWRSMSAFRHNHDKTYWMLPFEGVFV